MGCERKMRDRRLVEELHELMLFEVFNRNFDLSIDCLEKRNCGDRDRGNGKSWEEIKEEIVKGCVNLEEVVAHYWSEVLEELSNSGYVLPGFGWKKVSFSVKAERILGKKILEEALKNLEKRSYGDVRTKKSGFAEMENELVDYDSSLHTYDMIDIQESFVNEVLRTGNLELEERSAVVRSFKHSEKCTYIMLLDVSDSMRGEKLREAVKAVLSLKASMKHSKVYVFAFNQNVRLLRRGEILNVSARGRTNISLALKKAAMLSERVDGTAVVFLITDGEPTYPNQNPLEATLKAAKTLGKIKHVRFNVIMLSDEERYISFFLEVARRVENSKFFRANPDDLSSLVLMNA